MLFFSSHFLLFTCRKMLLCQDTRKQQRISKMFKKCRSRLWKYFIQIFLSEFEKSGVYEREKTPPKPKTLFEAAIPTSSVFVRDPEKVCFLFIFGNFKNLLHVILFFKEIFDVRARNSSSPRNSRNFEDSQVFFKLNVFQK